MFLTWRTSVENALKTLVVIGEKMENFDDLPKKYRIHDASRLVPMIFTLPAFSSYLAYADELKDLCKYIDTVSVSFCYKSEKTILDDEVDVKTYGTKTEEIIRLVVSLLRSQKLDVECPCLECTGIVKRMKNYIKRLPWILMSLLMIIICSLIQCFYLFFVFSLFFHSFYIFFFFIF